jgi:hypothetical protein
MSDYKVVQLGTVTPRKFDQLLDVNMAGVADGNLVAYAASTKTFVPYVGSGNIPPNLTISNINVSGVSTFGGVTISNGIITSSNPGFSSVVYYGDGSKLTGIVGISSYVPTSGFSTFSNLAYNIFGGQSGNLVYQSAPGVTTFVSNGTSGQVLTFNGTFPQWQSFIAPISGINVFDEGNLFGTALGLNFVGNSVSVSGVGSTAVITINTGISSYAATAGFATISGIASYSNLSGYSTSSGISTVSGYANISGYSTFSAVAGFATTSSKLQNIRTFEITGDIIASPQNFDGTQNVSFAATIKPDSVGLGTNTYGDYVKNITGTLGEIEVSVTSGEGTSPQIGLPDNVSVANNLTVGRDVQVNRNLNVNGNITIGGTSAYIIVDDFVIKDRDIVVGFTTNISGFDNSNDTTANTGGLAVASTEGSPLVNLVIAGIETLPATYKKIMWFQQNSFVGLNTDAWLFNYAVGVGSTQIPNGVWLASGNVQITKDDITRINNINSSGIITATNFVGNLLGFSSSSGISSFSDVSGFSSYSNLSGYSTTSGIATYSNVSGIATFAASSGVSTNVFGGTGNLTSLNVVGIITTGTINSSVGTITTLGVSSSFTLPLNSPPIPTARNLYATSNSLLYRDSANSERILLNNLDNLSNLSNISDARTNIGAAATGPVGDSGLTFTTTQRVFARNSVGVGSGEEVSLSQLLDWGSNTINTVLVRGASTWSGLGFSGGLTIQSGNVVPIDYIKFVITNKGESASPETNRSETTVPRSCIVIGASWELAPSATGSTSSQAMLYARRSGTKTSLLSSNATLTSGAILTDVTSTLTGTLTLAAGDTLGIDLIAVGTGSSGHIFTVTVRYI